MAGGRIKGITVEISSLRKVTQKGMFENENNVFKIFILELLVN